MRGRRTVKSMNMYKGPMDKNNREEVGRWWRGRAQESNGENGDNCS